MLFYKLFDVVHSWCCFCSSNFDLGFIVGLLLDVICFFFFKQKTAYEMRISDWSSDVCSSDLAKLRGAGTHARGIGQQPGAVEDQDGGGQVGKQIGRASCRERVCQYV